MSKNPYSKARTVPTIWNGDLRWVGENVTGSGFITQPVLRLTVRTPLQSLSNCEENGNSANTS
jgi:hypothetical protein